MKLREYLFHQNLTLTDFSKEIDYSRVHLSKIAHGQRKASRKMARAIEKATNGEVSIKELLGNELNKIVG